MFPCCFLLPCPSDGVLPPQHWFTVCFQLGSMIMAERLGRGWGWGGKEWMERVRGDAVEYWNRSPIRVRTRCPKSSSSIYRAALNNRGIWNQIRDREIQSGGGVDWCGGHGCGSAPSIGGERDGTRTTDASSSSSRSWSSCRRPLRGWCFWLHAAASQQRGMPSTAGLGVIPDLPKIWKFWRIL